MLIFGFGKRTGKDLGPGKTYTCPRCANNVRFRLVDQRSWFTLFFLPVIPYSHQYLEVCPICRYSQVLVKADFDRAVQASKDDHNYITGAK